MSITVQATQKIQSLSVTLAERGLKPGKAFRRYCARLHTAAITQDLDTIRAEVEATRKPSWGDQA